MTHASRCANIIIKFQCSNIIIRIIQKCTIHSIIIVFIKPMKIPIDCISLLLRIKLSCVSFVLQRAQVFKKISYREKSLKRNQLKYLSVVCVFSSYTHIYDWKLLHVSYVFSKYFLLWQEKVQKYPSLNFISLGYFVI